jgi:hypothetical protein
VFPACFCEYVQFCTDGETLIGLDFEHSKVDKTPWSRPPKWYCSITSAQTMLYNSPKTDGFAAISFRQSSQSPLHGLFFPQQGSNTELVHSRSAHQRLTGNSPPSMRTHFIAWWKMTVKDRRFKVTTDQLLLLPSQVDISPNDVFLEIRVRMQPRMQPGRMDIRMRSRRWWLIVGWFVALYVWNLSSVWGSVPSESGGLYVCLCSLSRLTKPVEILLSAAVIVLILEWKNRQQIDVEQ